jgi:DNA-binding transcriptional regulator YdaS (Cro superfamily)
MDKFRAYINSLPLVEQESFAKRCGTTIGYIRKKFSAGGFFGEGLCINFERESGGVIRVEDLRDDADWAYLRGTAKLTPSKSKRKASPSIGG